MTIYVKKKVEETSSLKLRKHLLRRIRRLTHLWNRGMVLIEKKQIQIRPSPFLFKSDLPDTLEVK